MGRLRTVFKKRPQPPTSHTRTPITRSPEQAKVFSYYSSRNVHAPEAGRTRQRLDDEVDLRSRARLQARLSSLPLVLSLAAIGICLAYNVTLSTQPRIIMTGTDAGKKLLREPAAYADQTHETLADSFLNRSKITFQTTAVQNTLAQKFPELSAVDVALPLMGVKPVVYLEAADPAAVLIAQDGASFVLDASGRVISTDVTKVPANIPVINDRSGAIPELGRQLLTSKDIAFIQQLRYQFEARSLTLESLLLPSGTQELQARLVGKPYYTRLSLREDAREQAGALIAALEYLESKSIVPSTYIDLRVGERVFYK